MTPTEDHIHAAIPLPWPRPGLSPNARAHWAERAKLVRGARDLAWCLALASGARNLGWPAALVRIEFRPPDRRRRDLDNMLAAIKPYLDGIADATGIDDSRWALTIERGEPVEHGAVVLTMTRDRGAA